MMKIRWFLLSTHGASAAIAAAGVAVGMLWLQNLMIAVIAPTIILGTVLGAWFATTRVWRGLLNLERSLAGGESASRSDVGILEIDNLAERFREYAIRWADSATNAREQARDVQDLVLQMNQSCNSGRVTIEGEATAHQLREVLDAITRMADSELQQILVCSQDIDKSTQEIAAGGEDQAEAVNKTTTYVEQMSANIDSVSQNAGAAHQAALAARESATEALELMRGLIGGMQSIRSHIEASDKKLHALGDRSQEIGSIIETIGTISARTDMLALNASIESVRAGEHGRGFAVVAEEVRKLAEQAAQATREVTGLIESVQMETQESIAVIADEHAQVEAEVRRVNAAGDALERISEISSESATRIGEISQAAQHQLQFTQEVVLAMERISEVAKGIRNRAEGVCWTTKTLTKLAEQLDTSLAPLRSSSDSRGVRQALPAIEAPAQPNSDRTPRGIAEQNGTDAIPAIDDPVTAADGLVQVG